MNERLTMAGTLEYVKYLMFIVNFILTIVNLCGILQSHQTKRRKHIMEKIQKNAAMIGKVLKILRGIVFSVGGAVLVFCVLSLFVPLDKLMDTANFTLELGPVELGIAPEFLPFR